MRRIFFTLIGLSMVTTMAAAATPSLNVETGKKDYWRYELVDIAVRANTPVAQAVEKLPARLHAVVWQGGRQVTTIGNMRQVPLVRDSQGVWKGYWPIPFNPRLGDYTCKLQQWIPEAGTTLTASAVFKIRGRKPYRLPDGFSVVTYEGGKYGPGKTPGIAPDSEPSWRNLIAWADEMGADAFWQCIGQTQIWGRRKDEQYPWSQYTVRLMQSAAKAAHDAGLQYGGWITSFVVIGDKPEETGYQFTLGYNREANALRQLRYVSLGCEKRIAHMIELLKTMEADPHVDYLGLDYMRTDFGGYEFAGDFIRDMSIDTPEGWAQWNESEKSLWMARLIEVTRDRDVRMKWRWWRAHKVGLVIEHIVEEVKPTKPLWVFSLGWQTGHQHGQDLLMMLDAGIGFNAPMFYSIDRPDFPHMLAAWKNYLADSDASVVIGEPVDWNLLQRTLDPAGPQDHLDRQTETIAALKPVSNSFGLFWHDLARAFFGARGPYGSREWIVAGATSFTRVKAAAKRLPMVVRLKTPVDLVLNRETAVVVEITNTSGNTLTAVTTELVPLPRLTACAPNPAPVESLAPGETRSVKLKVKTDSVYENNGGRQMVAVKVKSAETGARDPWFDFVYLPVTKTYGPTLPAGNTATAASDPGAEKGVEKKSGAGTIPPRKTQGVAR